MIIEVSQIEFHEMDPHIPNHPRFLVKESTVIDDTPCPEEEIQIRYVGDALKVMKTYFPDSSNETSWSVIGANNV